MKYLKHLSLSALIACLMTSSPLSSDPGEEAAAPLKALLITGGGYHDYAKQQHILSKGVSARANVKWPLSLENPKGGGLPEIYKDPDWAKAYDVIVHNE